VVCFGLQLDWMNWWSVHYPITITINISGGSSANPWQHDNNSTNNGLKEELIRCGDNNNKEREHKVLNT